MSVFGSDDNKPSEAVQAAGTMGLIFGEVASSGGNSKDIDPFKDVQAPESNDWSIPEAYVCILIAAVRADNKVEPEEVDYVKALVKRCKTLRGHSANALAQINLSVSERMRTRPDFIGEACRAMPRDMHMAVFAHCVDISLADGELDEKEKQFLDGLIDEMSITREDAKHVVEVIFEKNRY